jgi:hypothetical protein
MFPPDSNAALQLAREHQARLKQDYTSTDPSRPEVVESRRRHSPRLAWLLTRLRPARFAS